jgi:hypothetical protein
LRDINVPIFYILDKIPHRAYNIFKNMMPGKSVGIRYQFLYNKRSSDMLEKRRSKRLPVHLHLEISSLFNQDNGLVKIATTPIEVIDVSRTGIGFKTESVLPIDFYFNACLKFGAEDSKLYCVVKILRSEFIGGNTTIYGCEFVGLAPIFEDIFDRLEEEYTNDKT